MQIHTRGYDVSIATFVPPITSITGIALGEKTTIVFSAEHNYSEGEIVAFRVGPAWGTVQLNGQQAKVQVITPTSIEVDIDSREYTPFQIPVFLVEITSIDIDTPAPGSTRFNFVSNPYADGQKFLCYNVEGTIGEILNGFLFTVTNSNPTFFDIALASSGRTYTGGGMITAFPLSLAAEPPYVVPVGSGTIPFSNPATVNLEDAFDHVRTN